mgnify:CR=1 FL=1
MLDNCDSCTCKRSLFMQLYSWNYDTKLIYGSWILLAYTVHLFGMKCDNSLCLFRCLESAVPLLSLQLKVVWCHLHSRNWDSPLLPLLKGGLLFCVVKGEKLLLLYMYMFAKWGPYTLTPRCSIKCHRFSVVPALCSQHLRWLVLCLVELFMVFRLKYSIYIKTACSHFFSRNGMLFCILNSSLLVGLPCPWMYSFSSFSLALLTSTKVLSLLFPILQCR